MLRFFFVRRICICIFVYFELWNAVEQALLIPTITSFEIRSFFGNWTSQESRFRPADR